MTAPEPLQMTTTEARPNGKAKGVPGVDVGCEPSAPRFT
jgi:hypothetical protein